MGIDGELERPPEIAAPVEPGRDLVPEADPHRSAALATARTAAAPPPPLGPEQIVALQRTAGNQMVTRYLRDAGHVARPLASLRVLDRVRIARVPTWGGNWRTTRYKNFPAAPATPRGVDIEIVFTPNDKVNAKKIGIVQTAMSQSAGTAPFANTANYPDFGGRAIQKGKQMGLGIDQLEGYHNPLYPTEKGKATDTLGSTPLTPSGSGGGRHGWRFLDGAGKQKKRSAKIDDVPQLPVANDSKQVFETTALAIEGEQTGTYYGSVQWGWERDATGKFTRLPFKLKAGDAPSASLTAAGARWNAQAGHVQLPLAYGRWVKVAAPIVEDPAAAPPKELATLDVKTRLEVTNKGAGKPFNKGPDKWWKTTVLSGAQVGMVGWVLSANLDTKKPK